MAESNRKKNLEFARDWIQLVKSQCFVFKQDGYVHSLKCCVSPDDKILWMEFRTTGTRPSFSCPISLFEDPMNVRESTAAEWGNIKRIANLVEGGFTGERYF